MIRKLRTQRDDQQWMLDLAPALARRQLRVVPHIGGGVQASVGDTVFHGSRWWTIRTKFVLNVKSANNTS